MINQNFEKNKIKDSLAIFGPVFLVIFLILIVFQIGAFSNSQKVEGRIIKNYIFSK